MNTLWAETLRALLSRGDTPSRLGPTKEVIGYSVRLLEPARSFVTNPLRRLCPGYAAAEFLWYMSGLRNGSMIQRYAPSYKQYLDESGEAYGAYGPHITAQLPLVIEQLKQTDHSRQAVITFWEPVITLSAATQRPATRDVPCTVCLQYLVRDGQLHAVTYMRSNDAWLGLPYDVFAFTCLMRIVAAHLDLRIGTYTHCVGSMHLYAKHFNAARDARHYTLAAPAHPWRLDDTLSSLKVAVELEKQMRTDHSCCDEGRFGALGDMSRDLLRYCTHKLCIPVLPQLSGGLGPESDAMKLALERRKADGRSSV